MRGEETRRGSEVRLHFSETSLVCAYLPFALSMEGTPAHRAGVTGRQKVGPQRRANA